MVLLLPLSRHPDFFHRVNERNSMKSCCAAETGNGNEKMSMKCVSFNNIIIFSANKDNLSTTHCVPCRGKSPLMIGISPPSPPKPLVRKAPFPSFLPFLSAAAVAAAGSDRYSKIVSA